MPQQITTHADEERALEMALAILEKTDHLSSFRRARIINQHGVASAILRSKAEVLREFCVHFAHDPDAFKYINEMLLQAGRLEEAADRMENK